MALLRNPSVANQFYPGDANELHTMLNSYIADPEANIRPKAIIAPHAGYIYSGIVAGKTYSYLKSLRQVIKKVTLFGPAHRFGFNGIATSGVDFFATPLGNIPVSKTLIEKSHTLDFVHHEERAFNGEHCLEVQLPFLQTFLQQFEIAPFIISNCSSDKVAMLMEMLWGDQQTLIVISSDLSHFLNYEDCVKKDRITAKHIMQFQYDKLDYSEACGRTPIQGLLRVAQKKQMQIKQISVINSGDTAGDKQHVVGYGGWLLY